MMRQKGGRVPPLRKAEIRELADHVRKVFEVLGVQRSGKLDIVHVYEFILPRALKDFLFEVVDDNEMGEDHGVAYPDEARIVLKESVYEQARVDDGRSRFTMAHELGHLILHQNVSKFSRASGTFAEHPIWEDSEWQADWFAAELLMPFPEVLQCKDYLEVADTFGVSHGAAKYRLLKVK